MKIATRALTAAEILAVDDRPITPLEVPEWGGTIYTRPMTAAQRDHLEATLVLERDGKRIVDVENARAKILSATIVDEQGAPLFSDADVKALGTKSSAAIQRIFEAVTRTPDLATLTDG